MFDAAHQLFLFWQASNTLFGFGRSKSAQQSGNCWTCAWRVVRKLRHPCLTCSDLCFRARGVKRKNRLTTNCAWNNCKVNVVFFALSEQIVSRPDLFLCSFTFDKLLRTLCHWANFLFVVLSLHLHRKWFYHSKRNSHRFWGGRGIRSKRKYPREDPPGCDK